MAKDKEAKDAIPLSFAFIYCPNLLYEPAESPFPG